VKIFDILKTELSMPMLGPRIRELRQGRGLTLEQVAADTGLSVSFLSMLERDKVSISVDNLERLANYYEVHMVHFFSGPEASPVLVTRREQIVRTMLETGRGHAACQPSERPHRAAAGADCRRAGGAALPPA
jgi:transcriptional regulator with XRE-family HTH domain